MTDEMTIRGYAARLRGLWAVDQTLFAVEYPGLVDRVITHLSDADLVTHAMLAAAANGEEAAA